jgi:hypothetical protein
MLVRITVREKEQMEAAHLEYAVTPSDVKLLTECARLQEDILRTIGFRVRLFGSPVSD